MVLAISSVETGWANFWTYRGVLLVADIGSTVCTTLEAFLLEQALDSPSWLLTLSRSSKAFINKLSNSSVNWVGPAASIEILSVGASLSERNGSSWSPRKL